LYTIKNCPNYCIASNTCVQR